MARVTLEEAAGRLLSEPVGTRKTIRLHLSDNLSGYPPGTHPTGNQMRDVEVLVKRETAADGRKRIIVVEVEDEDGDELASGPWA